MTAIFVARQPIFELDHGLYGYELLYRRNGEADHADGQHEHMSADVIASALLGIGLSSLSGDRTAFINFGRDQLLSDSWKLFDPTKVVIELLENVRCDEETIAACQRLVKAGYRLALDDYVHADSSAFLPLASIVKIDVLGKTREELRAIVAELAGHKVRLLAERVETTEVRDFCAELGCDLFQGFLFSRPETLSKKDVSAGQLAVMRLLNLLQDTKTSDADLEAAFETDVALCYKLLRIVNAAAVGGRGVKSISHAIRMVGRQSLHRWLTVMLVASVGREGSVTHEVALTALTRARLCESVVRVAPAPRNADSAFIVGLLSLLDVLLDMPMETVLSRLELAEDIGRALLEEGGPYAAPLKLVRAYELGEWDQVRNLAIDSGVADALVADLYLDALGWATDSVAA